MQAEKTDEDFRCNTVWIHVHVQIITGFNLLENKSLHIQILGCIIKKHEFINNEML